MWRAVVLCGLLPVAFSAGAATAPIRPGPDPQFLPVEEEVSASFKQPTFSGGGKRLAPCPGTKNVFSFECYITPHRKAVRELPEDKQ